MLDLPAPVVGLIGAVLGIVLAKSSEWVLERRRRRMRSLELVIALHAEIAAGRLTAAAQSDSSEVAYLLANMTPFAPADRTDFVLRAFGMTSPSYLVKLSHRSCSITDLPSRRIC